MTSEREMARCKARRSAARFAAVMPEGQPGIGDAVGPVKRMRPARRKGRRVPLPVARLGFCCKLENECSGS